MRKQRWEGTTLPAHIKRINTREAKDISAISVGIRSNELYDGQKYRQAGC